MTERQTFADTVAGVDDYISAHAFSFPPTHSQLSDLLSCIREQQAALQPFAKFACDLVAGETHDCFNCRARAVLAKYPLPEQR